MNLNFSIENLLLSSSFFSDECCFYFNFLFFDQFFFSFNWVNFSSLNFINFSGKSDFFFENYLSHLENLNSFSNLENLTTLYHYSIPTTKLAYPEPFIASASFMHSDLWFVHILIYQYWLWFVFVFIIIFFFITFICTVRWCNLRVRPRRETRGVSRSKCGDLITACVPVSWATSIIISESTDAIDYFDGFGTTELVVGIRAYQWGWEYYYPKDIDLHYNIKNNYSSFIGNSLKYSPSSPVNLKNNNLWKFYQNKNSDHVITPAYLFLFSLENFKIFNYLNFNDIGANVLNESNIFRKIKNFSRFTLPFHEFSFLSFSRSYSVFSKFFYKNSSYFNSTMFGSKKQHNFVVNQNSFSKIYPHFKSSQKLLNFNYNFNDHKQLKISPVFFFLFENFYSNKKLLNFKNYLIFNQNYFFFNNNSDKKFLNNLFFKNNIIIRKNFLNNQYFFNSHSLFFYNSFSYKNFLYNFTFLNRSRENFSPNQALPTNSKFIKKFLNLPFLKTNLNLNNNLNLIEDSQNYFNYTNSNFLNIYNFTKTKRFNFLLFTKLSTNKIYLDSPHSPIVSNNIFFNSLNYDNCKNTLIPEVPSMFQSKEDLFPSYLYSTYWNFFWLHSSFNYKIKNYFISLKNFNSFYLPFFNLNYDYDFKNWQSLELLEDSIWDSFFNVFFADEYKTLNNFFYDFLVLSKNNSFFVLFDKFFNENDFNEIVIDFNSEYSTTPFSDNFYVNLTYLNLNSYFIFPTISNLSYIDDSFESYKNLNFLFYFFNKNFFFLPSNFFYYTSHLQFFNTFRSTFEEFGWTSSSLYNFSLFDKSLDLSRFNYNNLFNVRFNNYYNIRNTVKSSIVNFNALQKVFKTRLDENRSNAKLEDINKIYLHNTKQPFLTSTRPNYEKLIGKTHQSFYKLNLFKPQSLPSLSENYILFSSLNFYFFDFPFLLAYKSDSSRYLWIDWFAKWGFYEVQPSSSSKYSLHGMPYFNRYFEFTYEQNELLNETETYFTRLSKARKNYLTSWTYSPFFFWKNLSWFPFYYFNNSSNPLTNLNFNLNKFSWYWMSNSEKLNLNFITSDSNMNSFAKTSWRSQSSISSYYVTFNNFNDICTKKEYLYRKLFFNSNYVYNLPTFLLNSPNNPLLKELKSIFDYVDPIIQNNEFSKNLYYNSLEFFNYYYIFSLFNDFNFLNLNFFYKKIFQYFYLNPTSHNNDYLLKNTQRPLRKGINNMIRLHGTGAIAMPIEIRLQVLASSKDVIHSWAIPSAGVKIDCVPGYSSHKVMIFLVSGIFWGQCMEICGRYHHWMPIIVYFMKRDLFFLWCTHFVFLSGSNNIWSINDRQFTDYIKPVSYDKSSWIKEIIK